MVGVRFALVLGAQAQEMGMVFLGKSRKQRVRLQPGDEDEEVELGACFWQQKVRGGVGLGQKP